MKEHDVAETSFNVLCLACLQSGVDLSAAGVLLMFKKFETWGHFGFSGLRSRASGPVRSHRFDLVIL